MIFDKKEVFFNKKHLLIKNSDRQYFSSAGKFRLCRSIVSVARRSGSNETR